MKGCQPVCKHLKILVLMVLVVALGAGWADSARAGGWFKAAAGVSGMAMDDINNGDFRFYDYTADGFDFPTLNSGFSFSLHLGHDLSPVFDLGFSWERQSAGVEGTDQDVTAKLDLDSNFFMSHLYWTPLKKGSWEFGAAVGLGLVFPAGHVKVTGTDNVNYGEDDITGSSGLAVELMGLIDFALSDRSIIEVTIGWRDATIKDVKVGSRPVTNEDGSALALDYTGYTLKAGYKYLFGG